MKISNSSNRLKELMMLKGLKQNDIVKLTGIPKSTISLYLSGKREPKQDRLMLLSETFHVNPAWLMGFDVVMSTNPSTIELYQHYAFTSEMENVLSKYNMLTDTGKKKLTEFLDDLLKLYKKED